MCVLSTSLDFYQRGSIASYASAGITRALDRLLLTKFDARTHDKSQTTLQGYDTVGCSRLQSNLVIAGALQCTNFDPFYRSP